MSGILTLSRFLWTDCRIPCVLNQCLFMHQSSVQPFLSCFAARPSGLLCSVTGQVNKDVSACSHRPLASVKQCFRALRCLFSPPGFISAHSDADPCPAGIPSYLRTHCLEPRFSPQRFLGSPLALLEQSWRKLRSAKPRVHQRAGNEAAVRFGFGCSGEVTDRGMNK